MSTRRSLLIAFGILVVITSATAARDFVPGDWVRFTLTGRALMPGWGASSVLESDDPLRDSRYGPEKALDGDPASAWVEGAPGPGIGESYFLALEHVPEAMGFINGYAGNSNLFHKNHRVRELRVHLYGGVMIDGFSTEIADFFDARPLIQPVRIRLEDTMEVQRVPLPFDRRLVQAQMGEFHRSQDVRSWNFPQAREFDLDGSEGLQLRFRYIIKLEIIDIYRGSTWEDTCIAELWPDYGTASALELSSDARSLVIVKETGERIPSYADFEHVLTLVETSADNQWALVIQEPAYLEAEERATSSYAVVHAPSGQEVTNRLFDDAEQLGYAYYPLGFSFENGRTYLEYENASGGRSERVLCTLY